MLQVGQLRNRSNECIFCRIAQHQVPADLVTEDQDVVAFKDIHPQAPVHVLIVPKAHIPHVSDLTETNVGVMAKAVLAANRLAKQFGVEEGYRLVVNCGSQAGQSVWHLHLHLLGGRPMRWPPG